METVGTPEAFVRINQLRKLEVAHHRAGGFDRWIAKQDAEGGNVGANGGPPRMHLFEE